MRPSSISHHPQAQTFWTCQGLSSVSMNQGGELFAGIVVGIPFGHRSHHTFATIMCREAVGQSSTVGTATRYRRGSILGLPSFPPRHVDREKEGGGWSCQRRSLSAHIAP